MKILSYLFFYFCFLFQYFVFAQTIQETVSEDFFEFQNLNNIDYNSLDWADIADIANQYWTAENSQRFLEHLKSVGIRPSSVLNLIQSPDYLQVQGDINVSFFNISPSELEELTNQTRGEASAADTFVNFVGDLLIESSFDEDAVMGEKWIEDIIKYTDTWTTVEARKFLNFLSSKGIKPESIIRVLKSTDYLQALKAGRIKIIMEGVVVHTQTATVPLAQQVDENQIVSEEYIQSEKIRRIVEMSQVGSDVFINYVREHLQEEFEKNKRNGESLDNYVNRQMASNRSPELWTNRISKKSQYWNVTNAGLLLYFLEEEMQIEPSVIINMFRSAVSFFGTNYASFMDKINIYRQYLTKEEIREILENHFSAFQFGKPGNIIELLSFLEDYIGEENTKKILKNNLKTIAVASSRIPQLNQNIEYLEKYLGKGEVEIGKAKLKNIISNGGFAGIVDFIVYKNEDNDLENARVKWLKSRNLSQDKIIELIENNPLAFSIGDLSEEKIDYLEEYLGKGNVEIGREKLTGIIKKGGLEGIILFKIYKNENGKFENKRVVWLKDRGLSQDDIIELIENNSFAFTAGDLSEKKITYLEKYLGKGDMKIGREKLNDIIKRGGFVYIVKFKVYENEDGDLENVGIKWLEERSMSQDKIIKIIEKSPEILYQEPVSEEVITYLENYLGKGNMEVGWVKLNNIMIEKGVGGIERFKVYRNKNDDLENVRVKWLKDRGLSPDEIIKVIEDDPLAFSVGDLSKEKINYLEHYFGQGNMEIGKAKFDDVIRNGGFLGIVKFKVYENEDGDLENARVKWLEDRDLSPEDIIELIENSPLAFSVGDLARKKIVYLKRYLGKGDIQLGKEKLNNIVKSGGFYGVVLFKIKEVGSNHYENDKVKALEEMGYTQDQIIELMEEHLLEVFSRDITIEQSKAALEELIRKGEVSFCKDALI